MIIIKILILSLIVGFILAIIDTVFNLNLLNNRKKG
jgi:hypothetical protein